MSTTRDPDKTRHRLLEAAFSEMYEVGFQAASIDRILRSTGVTKGALYHHFRGKRELGYAVVDEVVAGWIRERWVQPLERSGDPLDLIAETVRRNVEWALESGMIAKGCPLNNLAQEMSPLDEGFRSRIQSLLVAWRDAFAGVLARGQADGAVRDDIDPVQMGAFIVATLEGMAGMMKTTPEREVVEGQLGPFLLLLDGLRPSAARAA